MEHRKCQIHMPGSQSVFVIEFRRADFVSVVTVKGKDLTHSLVKCACVVCCLKDMVADRLCSRRENWSIFHIQS